MSTLADRYQPWVSYPGTVLLALSLHWMLVTSAMPLAVSAYLPVVLAAAVVTWLEWRFPYHLHWRPARPEVGQDLLFMLVVQLALPRLLALGLALIAAQLIGGEGPLVSVWPHHLPVVVQAVLMLFAADFLRYWLHVAAHRHPWLWRLHAVHHSPQRLYWLNVGRFHPLDKTLQFLLDVAPFLLMSVNAQVIALYFVFYAVNGFFQHSNIRLRYGVLNYLISSAELHRWHHSRLSAESNRNYGNNMIVWDLLFGTWFMPRDRQVGNLGLLNQDYPRSFRQQLITPFTPGIADRAVPLQDARALAGRLFVWLYVQWFRLSRWWPTRFSAVFPQRAQARVLRRLLRRAERTRFGREHNLARVRSAADFMREVPVQDYEQLRSYFDAEDAGEVAAIVPEPPFMYAVTSGTGGEPKFLPVSRFSLRQYRAAQQLYTFMSHRFCPAAFAGHAFGLVSPAVEGYRPSGRPYGSVSGYLATTMPRVVRRRYVVPPEVSEIGDTGLKYRVMLRLALAAPDISYLAGANPSSFLLLLTVLKDGRESLACSLEEGTLDSLGPVPEALVEKLADRIEPQPDRAAQLRRFAADWEPSFSELWPDIRLLTVWTGGSCGVALEALRARLPGHTRIVELGYLASELWATVTIDADTGAGLPLLRQHYFEFIERTDYESGHERICLLHELQPGREYYIVITTGAGLFRYFINDIVRVVGCCGRTPTLRFVQKGRGVTSITGEKLYENQVLQALQEAAAADGFTPVFVMALADEFANVYRLYLEAPAGQGMDVRALGRRIDARLGELNREYRGKRDSGRLGMLEVWLLQPGTGEAYRHHCVSLGQREGQFKVMALQTASGFEFPIERYTVAPHD